MFTVTVRNVLYGPAYGASKTEAKGAAAVLACDHLGLYHTGVASECKYVVIVLCARLGARLFVLFCLFWRLLFC